jgi:hypothetical protein
MKTKEPRTIHLDPNSELARALSSSKNESVYLDSNGKRFRVIRVEDDLWKDYDPEAVRKALQEVAGTLSPEEGERMKELIYRARDEGTRPIERP